MSTFWASLSGWKTYIVAASGVLGGIAMLMDGNLEEGIQTILIALGFGALRNAR